MTTEEKAKRIDELLESIKSHSRLVGMAREKLSITLDEKDLSDVHQHQNQVNSAQEELIAIIKGLLYK